MGFPVVNDTLAKCMQPEILAHERPIVVEALREPVNEDILRFCTARRIRVEITLSERTPSSAAPSRLNNAVSRTSSATTVRLRNAAFAVSLGFPFISCSFRKLGLAMDGSEAAARLNIITNRTILLILNRMYRFFCLPPSDELA